MSVSLWHQQKLLPVVDASSPYLGQCTQCDDPIVLTLWKRQWADSFSIRDCYKNILTGCPSPPR